MSMPSVSDLKKLASACRKAGIKTFKSSEYEITLTDDAPVSNYKKTKPIDTSEVKTPSDVYEDGALTQEQLMFWSSDNSVEHVTLQE